MDKRNIYIIVAIVVVLAVVGYSLGWFGGSAPEPAATAPTPAPEAPATTAPATGTTTQ